MHTLIVSAIILATGVRPAGQDDALRAAAQLTGLTAGMATVCALKTTPVLHAFRDLMDRKRILGAERKRLVALVGEANDRGVATQHKPGAMPCQEVKAQVRRTIRRLQRAK
jgi:hypothetical protein